MTYAPEADSPGARAAQDPRGMRNEPHRPSPGAGLQRHERMDVAKQFMRGARTAEDEQGPHVPAAPTRQYVDDQTIKAAATDAFAAGNVAEAEEAYGDELALEEAMHVEWFSEGLEQGWVDETGALSDQAPPEWVQRGQQAGYFGEPGDLGDDEFAELYDDTP